MSAIADVAYVRALADRVIELDPNYPEPYAWMGPLYKAVLAKLEPEKPGYALLAGGEAWRCNMV